MTHNPEKILHLSEITDSSTLHSRSTFVLSTSPDSLSSKPHFALLPLNSFAINKNSHYYR